jgi:hypothetical protein
MCLLAAVVVGQVLAGVMSAVGAETGVAAGGDARRPDAARGLPLLADGGRSHSEQLEAHEWRHPAVAASGGAGERCWDQAAEQDRWPAVRHGAGRAALAGELARPDLAHGVDRGVEASAAAAGGDVTRGEVLGPAAQSEACGEPAAGEKVD